MSEKRVSEEQVGEERARKEPVGEERSCISVFSNPLPLDRSFQESTGLSRGKSLRPETIAKLSRAEARERIPAPVARRHQILPIALQQTSDGGELLVALVTERFSEEDRQALRTVVNGALLTEGIEAGLLAEALTLAYHLDAQPQPNITKISQSTPRSASITVSSDPKELLRRLIACAELLRSSDIHIRRQRLRLEIAFRVDGRLIAHDAFEALSRSPDAEQSEAFIRYLRQLSGCDITKTHLPAEGGFHYISQGTCLRIRGSFIPTESGSTNVLRILRDATLAASAGECPFLPLGLLPTQRDVIQCLIHRDRGAVISCGPTGSGKSTLIAHCVQELSRESRKIISIEDPVEYRHSNVEQIDLSRTPGITVDTILPLVLRQDPDIIVVGEMRTPASARLSLEAATTGHLIFSTLHAATPEEANARLRRLVAPDYDLLGSILAFVLQKLVPRACQACRRDETAPTVLKELFGIEITNRSVGCIRCQHSGIDGRIGLFEIVSPQQLAADQFTKRTRSSCPDPRPGRSNQPELLPFYDSLRQHLRNGIITSSTALRSVGDLSLLDLREALSITRTVEAPRSRQAHDAPETHPLRSVSLPAPFEPPSAQCRTT